MWTHNLETTMTYDVAVHGNQEFKHHIVRENPNSEELRNTPKMTITNLKTTKSETKHDGCEIDDERNCC